MAAPVNPNVSLLLENMVSVATRALQLLKQRQDHVDLYRDHVCSESLSGVVTDYSDDFVYLSLFADSGFPNGVAVCRRDDITRLRWDGNERRSIAELVAAAGSRPTAPPLVLDSIHSILHSVAAAFGYVNVLTERMDDSVTFIGEIVEMDEDSLVLNTFGTFSSRDRSRLILNISDITRVDADAAYEKSVAYLAKKEG